MTKGNKIEDKEVPQSPSLSELSARLTGIVEIAPRPGVMVGDATRKLRQQDAKRLSEIL